MCNVCLGPHDTPEIYSSMLLNIWHLWHERDWWSFRGLDEGTKRRRSLSALDFQVFPVCLALTALNLAEEALDEALCFHLHCGGEMRNHKNANSALEKCMMLDFYEVKDSLTLASFYSFSLSEKMREETGKGFEQILEEKGLKMKLILIKVNTKSFTYFTFGCKLSPLLQICPFCRMDPDIGPRYQRPP